MTRSYALGDEIGIVHTDDERDCRAEEYVRAHFGDDTDAAVDVLYALGLAEEPATEPDGPLWSEGTVVWRTLRHGRALHAVQPDGGAAACRALPLRGRTWCVPGTEELERGTRCRRCGERVAGERRG